MVAFSFKSRLDKLEAAAAMTTTAPDWGRQRVLREMLTLDVASCTRLRNGHMHPDSDPDWFQRRITQLEAAGLYEAVVVLVDIVDAAERRRLAEVITERIGRLGPPA